MADETKKQMAKLKRKATELAGEIHDIVEDTLFEDYDKLEELSRQTKAAVEKYLEFKKANA